MLEYAEPTTIHQLQPANISVQPQIKNYATGSGFTDKSVKGHFLDRNVWCSYREKAQREMARRMGGE